MIFPRSFIIALVSAPFLVAAQQPNPPTLTTYNVTAGQPFTLTWQPTTQGTVSLVLRSGASSNLNAGTTIASNIENTGSYTWDVPSTEVRGSDYTIEIVDDADPSQTNYTPYFVLESTVTVASSSLSSVTLGAPTTSLSLSTAATASPTATTTGSSQASTTGTATTHASSSGMTTHASTSSSSTQAGLVASSTTSSHAGAARATAMVGMLGAVALGALAL